MALNHFTIDLKLLVDFGLQYSLWTYVSNIGSVQCFVWALVSFIVWQYQPVNVQT